MTHAPPTISPEDLSLLRAEIRKRGVQGVAKILGMSRTAVASVAAEVAHAGTNAMAIARMPSLTSAPDVRRASHDPGARHDPSTNHTR